MLLSMIRLNRSHQAQTNRFWIFVLASITAMLLAMAGFGAYIWFSLSPEYQTMLMALGQSHLYTLLAMAFILFGALWVVFDITYNRYILPLKRMSAEAGVIWASNPSHRIRVKGGRDVVRMAGIINDFADMFENLNKTITQQILAARKETEKERNLLAAIMAELPQGIVICNKNGRIILFNSLARNLFSIPGPTPGAEHYLGLGRSIFHLLDKALIAHAMDEIAEQILLPGSPVGSFFITPVASGLLISVAAIPVLDHARQITGFILALEEVSEEIRKYQEIDRYLSTFQENLDKMHKNGSRPLPHIRDAFKQLSDTIREMSFSRLPLTTLSLSSFLPSLQKKLATTRDVRVNIYNPHPDVRILADTYSMTLGLVFIFEQLSGFTGLKEFDLSVSHAQKEIWLNIRWEGGPCRADQVNTMIRTRLASLPTLGYILKFNNARLELVPGDTSQCTGLRIIARQGSNTRESVQKSAPVFSDSRPEFYDFNLFSPEDTAGNLVDTPLKKLTYTVFDTETTGLNPEGGDEIISIGAVRIVNARIVYQDIFEELVNPGRDIPMESYKIHGIHYEMIRKKPPIEEVLPQFSRFVSNTVLLGHNIAFDMKMLKVKEAATGIRFINPVLDTLLLSAVLHPVHEQHDMENIARRLGVNVIGRHTALGDAIATAEIFLKLLPILNANGILTLKDALRASKRTYYARLKY